MNKIALITGVTGQDGAYLTNFLLKKGYIVHGLKRRSSSLNTKRLDTFYNKPQNASKFFLHYGDLTDPLALVSLIIKTKPNEIYNLGAQSHVGVSFQNPHYTSSVDALGTLNILEAIRIANLEKTVKFYQASTSELYGKVQEIPQKETTPFYPRSPYGVAKLYSYWITKNYRESYDMFAVNGILFNHESPLRGETFVTRKITRAVAKIFLGLEEKLFIGNLNSKRDWGHAREYVEGMWKMLQREKPVDFVLATGITTTIREFVKIAFKVVNIDIDFNGDNENETGKCRKTNRELISVDKKYYRPAEVDLLVGDPTKSTKELNWSTKIKVEQLAKQMVLADIYSELRTINGINSGLPVEEVIFGSNDVKECLNKLEKLTKIHMEPKVKIISSSIIKNKAA